MILFLVGRVLACIYWEFVVFEGKNGVTLFVPFSLMGGLIIWISHVMRGILCVTLDGQMVVMGYHPGCY